MKSSVDPDLKLVEACRNPDSDEFEAAFEALYHRYKDRVYSIAFRVSGSATDAMDVVQETFSVLFRKIDSFRCDSLFSTWLFRIVVNCSIDSKRQVQSQTRGQTRSLSQLPSAAEPLDEQTTTPEESAQTSELETHIHDSIQRLSPKLRAILVLRYLEGLSYQELCQALEISMGTVKSRLARAHLALQRILAGTLQPFGYADLDQALMRAVGQEGGPDRGPDRGPEDSERSEGVA